MTDAMSSATLNIKVSPRRMLNERESAEYCGIPPKRFSTTCPVTPVLLADQRRYDMKDLDEWLDGLKSGAPNDDDTIIGKLGK